MNDLLSPRRSRRGPGQLILIVLIIGLVAGAALWWTQRDRAGEVGALSAKLDAAGIDAKERVAIEALVHDYILEHPEILPQAMKRLQARDAGRQIAALRPALETPFPGAVLGNPNGTRTIVEFTDYACSYCKASVADLKAMIAADPQLKVVIRELPIFPDSEATARAALGAAAQGRYAAFHDALFAAQQPEGSPLAAAAAATGIDLRAARAAGNSQAVTAELTRNQDIARQLGINGTPAWVIGDRLLSGAVGRAALEQALAAPAMR